MPHVESASPRKSFLEPYTPMLFSILKEKYYPSYLLRDLLAGLTVAIFGLPLSMAIGNASGARPEVGLYASIIGGFVASMLGGGRFQITGPLAAFVVSVNGIITLFGYQGFLLATIIAGAILIMGGILKLGSLIRYVPYSLILGLIIGIVVNVFLICIPDITGIPDFKAAGVFNKAIAIWNALPNSSMGALIISALCAMIVYGLRRTYPMAPEFLIAVVVAGTTSWGFAVTSAFSVVTIGSKFNGIPSQMPTPQWPDFTPDLSFFTNFDLIGAILTIVFLSSLTSLISAVVGDRMTQTRHRPNCELIAQGAANIASALFGGLCVAGTVARTATNVRAHAYSPLAGMFHSLFLLLTILVAAPLAVYIPLASLATVLLIVAIDMIEWRRAWDVLRYDRGDAIILITTLLLTIFTSSLLYPIGIGILMGAILFMYRATQHIEVTPSPYLIAGPQDMFSAPIQQTDDTSLQPIMYRLSGPLYFGTSPLLNPMFEDVAQRGGQNHAFILDFSDVSFADETGTRTLLSLIHDMHKSGSFVYLLKVSPSVRRTLLQNGIDERHASFIEDEQAIPRMQ